MARADKPTTSRVKLADTVAIAPEANKGLLTPCVKEPERARIDQKANEGLLTPCVKQAAGVRIELATGDGLLTPCVKEPERIAIDRVADEGLLVPYMREADVITIAVRGDTFIRGTQAGTNGQILFDNPASDRPYWDQNSRDTYDPAAEVTISGRSPYYSSDFFLIA